jgi:hypothetical protein
MDRDARKQVLLTRIAFERIELRRDVARVQQSVHIPNLLRTVIGAKLGPSPFKGRAPGKDGWIGVALSALRRYRLAAALLGGVLPVVRGRKVWKRITTLGAIGAAAWFGYRALTGRDKQT